MVDQRAACVLKTRFFQASADVLRLGWVRQSYDCASFTAFVFRVVSFGCFSRFCSKTPCAHMRRGSVLLCFCGPLLHHRLLAWHARYTVLTC